MLRNDRHSTHAYKGAFVTHTRNIPHLLFRWHWLFSRATSTQESHEWRIDLLVIVCALRPASGHPTTIFFLSSFQWSALYPSSRCLSIHPFGFEGHGDAVVQRPAVRCEPEEVSFGLSQSREAIYSTADERSLSVLARVQLGSIWRPCAIAQFSSSFHRRVCFSEKKSSQRDPREDKYEILKRRVADSHRFFERQSSRKRIILEYTLFDITRNTIWQALPK